VDRGVITANDSNLSKGDLAMSHWLKWMLPTTAALALVVGFTSLTARAAEEGKEAAKKGNIAGTVLDKDGKAAEGVTVNLIKPRMRGGQGGGGQGGGEKKPEEKKPEGSQLQAQGGGGRPTPIATATTDKDGKFTMNDVAVGDYMVGVRDTEKKLYGREKVTVEDGKTATVEIKCTDTPPQRGGGGGGGKGGAGAGGQGGGNGGDK
jgi:hypothetical protein